MLSSTSKTMVFVDNQQNVYQIIDKIPQQINEIQNVIEISCGFTHFCCVNSDGELWGFGCDTSHQFNEVKSNLPLKIENIPFIQSVSCGYDHTEAIDENQNVWSFGDSFRALDQSSACKRIVPEVENALKVFCGINFFWVLCKNGKLYYFKARQREPKIIINQSNVQKIITGFESEDSYLILSDGSLYRMQLLLSDTSIKDLSPIFTKILDFDSVRDAILYSNQIVCIDGNDNLFIPGCFNVNNNLQEFFDKKIPINRIFQCTDSYFSILDDCNTLSLIGSQFPVGNQNSFSIFPVPEGEIQIQQPNRAKSARK